MAKNTLTNAAKLLRDRVADGTNTIAQLKSATTRQLRQVIVTNLVGVDRVSVACVNAARRRALKFLEAEAREAKRNAIVARLKVYYPDVVIERDRSAEKPCYKVWPEGKPAEPEIPL